MTIDIPWSIIAALMIFCVAATGTAMAQNTPLGAATNAIGTLTIVRTDGVQQRLARKGQCAAVRG